MLEKRDKAEETKKGDQEDKRVTELEMQLKLKDQQIKGLTKIVRRKSAGGLPGGLSTQ